MHEASERIASVAAALKAGKWSTAAEDAWGGTDRAGRLQIEAAVSALGGWDYQSIRQLRLAPSACNLTAR